MKYWSVEQYIKIGESRPARGAWVEMDMRIDADSVENGRAPQGARGLKFFKNYTSVSIISSRPARGAWVEISS